MKGTFSSSSQRSDGCVLDEAEDLADEAGVAAADAGGAAGLAEVLAGEPGRDEFDVGEPVELADVVGQPNDGEAVLEHRDGGGVVLAQQARRVPGGVQTEFDAADPGEQTGDAQSPGDGELVQDGRLSGSVQTTLAGGAGVASPAGSVVGGSAASRPNALAA